MYDRRAAPPRRRPGRQRGYNLVVLMVLISIMSIGLAAAGPFWSKVIQREKEEELIFRGMQYAEALRVFQERFGRPPNRLEELLEAEPRSIRQLWTDPMTESGKWVVLAGNGQPGAAQSVEEWAREFQGAGGGAKSVEEWAKEFQGQAGGAQSVEEWAAEFGRNSDDEVQVGPIQGVVSKSDGESYRIFRGASRYDQWRFTAELVPGTDGPEGQPRTPYVGISWMTRNLPASLVQPGSGSGVGDLFGDGGKGDGEAGVGEQQQSDDGRGDPEEAGKGVEEGSEDPFDFDFQSEEDMQKLEDLFLDQGGEDGSDGG